MTEIEMKSLSDVLFITSAVLSRNGCNDVPNSLWDGWNLEEMNSIANEFEYYNSNGADYIEGCHTILYNDSAMLWLFHKKISNTISLSMKERRLVELLLRHALPNFRSVKPSEDITFLIVKFIDKINSREERLNALNIWN